MSWIRSPKLFAAAMKRARDLAPAFSRTFWEKVRQLYEGAGGQFIEADERSEGELGAEE